MPFKVKRPLKLAVWILAGIALVWVGLTLLVMKWGNGTSTETAREIPSHELADRLRHVAPGVQVFGGLEASSLGGWHGDGGSVSIYLIDPAGADAVLVGIKSHHQEQRKQWAKQWPDAYDFTWSDGSIPHLGGLERRIPANYLPPPGDYTIGRDRRGNHVISIGKTNGYYCGSYSQF